MKKLILILAFSICARAQWSDPPASGLSSLNAFLQSLAAAKPVTSLPATCTAGKDLFVLTTSAPKTLHYCDATNHLLPVETLAMKDQAGGYVGITAAGNVNIGSPAAPSGSPSSIVNAAGGFFENGVKLTPGGSYPGVTADGTNGLDIAGGVQITSGAPTQLNVVATTVGALPLSGNVVEGHMLVSDGVGANDCTVGGGGTRHWCYWNGSAWVSEGVTITGARTIDCVFASVALDAVCYSRVPVSGTITGWAIEAAGSSPGITIDVLKIATGAALPTSSITASAIPALTSTANAAKSTTLTGWTTALAADDLVGFKVTVPGNATWAAIHLYYTAN